MGIEALTAEPFTSVIHFRVRAGAEAAFEAAFEATGMLTRPSEIEGFRGAKLLRSDHDPGEYLVIGEWLDRNAYRNWQALSGKGADPEALGALMETLVAPEPGRLFTTVASSARSTLPPR